MNYYLLFKSLHLIAVISWMAGLLYLPRIFVYHVENNTEKNTSETFKIMERRLMFFIMTPAMILSWFFGIFLIPQKTDFVEIENYGSSERPGVDILTSQEINFKKTILFFGPLEYDQIASLGVGLEDKLLGWQWLSSISWLIYTIMVFLYGLIPNYGIVIILFAVLIKAITYPLMAKQLRSTKKMQKIQPQLKKIQEKYKNDSPRLNREMMSLYKEKGVNPFGGCLPMLIQMPLLFSLFIVFRLVQKSAGQYKGLYKRLQLLQLYLYYLQ